ncbi:MAG: response regulator [Hungatella sp.]
MRNVLIVDDDTIVRITLHSLVNWEELGYHIVADAIHGEQALQYLAAHPVDLVITDMKMPVLDGIGLLEALNQKEPKPKALVLSGYDDFKLVRDAFRLGAYDYLLKTDLNETLLQTMLERLHDEEWEDVPDPRGLPVDRVRSKGQLLVDMAMGRRSLSDEFFGGDYLVIQFEIEDFQKHSGRFDTDLEEGLVKPMLEFAGQIPRVASRCILGSISPSRYVMLYHVSDQIQYRENVLSTCKQLCNVWNNYMNLPVSAGISRIGHILSEFPDRFEESGRQLKLRCLKGKSQIDYPWEVGIMDFDLVCKTGQKYQKLLQALLLGDELAAAEEKQGLFAEFHTIGLESAKACSLCLIAQTAWRLQENHDDINALFAEEVNYYEKIGRLDELRNLELWINNYFRWILDYIQHHHDRRQADLMIRAKRFILDNYANPELTLGSVAGYIGLNEKYFSSRFTKEEGTTFSNYLTEVRIRKAKELMEQTDLKVYEISQSVGYNSVEHFTRVFKKMCKVSPGGYRNI